MSPEGPALIDVLTAEGLFNVDLPEAVIATLTDDGADGALIGVNDTTGQYFVIDTTTDPATEVGLLLNGAAVNAAAFAEDGFTMTQAVANPEGGYNVLFENSDGRVVIWTHDADGNRIAREDVVTADEVGAPDEAAVWAAEELFQVDLAADADDVIGAPPATDTVIATLTDDGADGALIGVNDTTGQYFVIDTTTDPDRSWSSAERRCRECECLCCRWLYDDASCGEPRGRLQRSL